MASSKFILIAVIPAYKAAATIKSVVKSALIHFDHVIVIDDHCPQNSGSTVSAAFPREKKLSVIRNTKNLGVGGASKRGFQSNVVSSEAIFVKVDADGQMDLAYLDQLIGPLIDGQADFTKGNRFSSRSNLEGMPKIRLLGNSFLTLMNRFSSGLWNISDPTNGFIALTSNTIRQVAWEKISDGYLFETQLLFRVSMLGLRVEDVAVPAVYNGEQSSLRPWRLILPLFQTHVRQYARRLFIQYFVREMNPGSLYLAGGLGLFLFGLTFGALNWFISASEGSLTPPGTISISTVAIILGFQLLLQFTAFDSGKAGGK